MITVIPVKNSSQLDLGKELEKHLENYYSNDLARKQSPSCDYVNGLRAKIVANLSKPDSMNMCICYLFFFKILKTCFWNIWGC
jgi:hypothetical protein